MHFRLIFISALLLMPSAFSEESGDWLYHVTPNLARQLGMAATNITTATKSHTLMIMCEKKRDGEINRAYTFSIDTSIESDAISKAEMSFDGKAFDSINAPFESKIYSELGITQLQFINADNYEAIDSQLKKHSRVQFRVTANDGEVFTTGFFSLSGSSTAINGISTVCH